MIAERLAAQLLSGPPAGSAGAVAERLLAIQAQDPRGARLAVRARSAGLIAADVDRALDARELVVTWLNRGTLHLVRREDYPWLHALTAPPHATGNARRLAQEGVTDPERAVAAVERALAADGPLTRDELAGRLGLRGQAVYHVLFAASRRGLVVRGPLVGREHAFALVRDWLGEQPPVERDRALAELARRYLAGHGPAGERDLAKWAGLPLRDARAALAAVAPELVQRDGLVDLGRRGEPPPLPPPRLLGPFDPLLHGWVSREPVLGAHTGVVTSNGIFRPVALVDGRAVATWRLEPDGPVLEPFAALDEAAFADERRDVLRFLGR